MPPKVCVRNNPASIRIKINASPMSAARRLAGGGSGVRSGGCQGSGFLMAYFNSTPGAGGCPRPEITSVCLIYNGYIGIFLAVKSGGWRRLSIKCRAKRGACRTVSVGSRYANGEMRPQGVGTLISALGSLCLGFITEE